MSKYLSRNFAGNKVLIVFKHIWRSNFLRKKNKSEDLNIWPFEQQWCKIFIIGFLESSISLAIENVIFLTDLRESNLVLRNKIAI